MFAGLSWQLVNPLLSFKHGDFVIELHAVEANSLMPRLSARGSLREIIEAALSCSGRRRHSLHCYS